MLSFGQKGSGTTKGGASADASILKALDQAQAIIRFQPDGTIEDANANFCSAVGYSLDEIVGKHHRIFCSDAYTNSAEYKQFWDELARGEEKHGKYKRFNKAGDLMWLEASYNPICDDQGNVVGVVKFAIDITEPRKVAVDAQGKMEAISRAQAVIEFDKHGNILTANDNFLDAVGYSLGEVKGKHHRIFCEPSYADSPEYADLWRRLAGGQFEAGQFKRFGRGGKEIWIQASYNPILDEDGAVVKVVKFATDITEQRAALETLQTALVQLAKGDLSARLPDQVLEDFAAVFSAFNNTVSHLSEMVDQIRGSADQLLSGSTSISSGASALSQRGEQQAASLQETNAAMEQMSERIKSAAQNASKVRAAANEAAKGVSQGEDIVRSAIAAMDRIEASSKQVTDIIKVIDSIAFQTNILSLNAAVEAARAGDAGKGFAVVAQEVRQLAQRSADAAKDITGLIQASTKEVDTGSRYVRQSGEVLSEINTTTDTVVQNITAISESAEEQSLGVTEIHRSISELDRNTQNNAHLAVESADQAAAMAELARNLSDLIAYFSSESAARAPAPQQRAGAA